MPIVFGKNGFSLAYLRYQALIFGNNSSLASTGIAPGNERPSVRRRTQRSFPWRLAQLVKLVSVEISRKLSNRAGCCLVPNAFSFSAAYFDGCDSTPS